MSFVKVRGHAKRYRQPNGYLPCYARRQRSGKVGRRARLSAFKPFADEFNRWRTWRRGRKQ